MKLALTFAGLISTFGIAPVLGAHIRNLSHDHCKQLDVDGNCISCYPRNYVKDGACVAVSDLCDRWSQTTGQCTSCYPGYALSQGKCAVPQSSSEPAEPVEPAPQIDLLCQKFAQDGSCQTCAWRSVKIDGKCQKVSDLCLQWDSATGDCTQCYGGYALNDGECIVGA